MGDTKKLLRLWARPTAGAELSTIATALRVVADTNATTGWVAANSCAMSSQNTVKDNSSYAILAENNTTPGASGKIAYNLKTLLSLTEGQRVLVNIRARHVGVGGDWRLALNNANSAVSPLMVIGSLTSTETDFKTYIAAIVVPSVLYLVVHENNAGNNGGVYLDNMSVRALR